ncbi:MAG: hypothetical protein ACHBN1_28210 [Heteroscytonema crispum UTEX LB 1556]
MASVERFDSGKSPQIKLVFGENTTWYIMTDYFPGDIQLSVGNTYGLRTWIEYGFKQSKNELGWAGATPFGEVGLKTCER